MIFLSWLFTREQRSLFDFASSQGLITTNRFSTMQKELFLEEVESKMVVEACDVEKHSRQKHIDEDSGDQEMVNLMQIRTTWSES